MGFKSDKFISPPEMRRALTVEELARKPCRFFHRWKLAIQTPTYYYYQCTKCCDRKVKQMFIGGYSVYDTEWYNGGAW